MTTSRNKKLARKGRRPSFDKASADTWLEYRYGWIPIISDTMAIIKKAYTGRQHDWYKSYVERCSANRSASASSLQGENYVGNYLGPTFKVIGTGSVNRQVRIRSGIRYGYMPISGTEEWLNFLGLNLASAIPTAWELVPFSFVADWFIGVGSWLNASKRDPLIRVKNTWLTECELTQHKKNAQVIAWNGNYQYTGNATPMFERTNRYERNVGILPPTWPTLVPTKLSGTHLVDGLALSSQTLSESVKKWLRK